ncbi:hypothetical protein JTE90_029238 [Oedothorax gibbosus]|uniref:C2H2-type domain-containing protein n=1 Tax=Oedothorax gibbosus TaxID=931172 RepID=A0AAV6TVQ5_9ARAC|nr:hypothetical protein JTE90_029238 [Oedothorax gibbosus]
MEEFNKFVGANSPANNLVGASSTASTSICSHQTRGNAPAIVYSPIFVPHPPATSSINSRANASTIIYSPIFGPHPPPTPSNLNHCTHPADHNEDLVSVDCTYIRPLFQTLPSTSAPAPPKALSPPATPTFAHVCTNCRKTFTRKDELTRHMKTHAKGSIGLDCKVCDKVFTREDNLARHMKKHESEEHVCPECPKTFIRKDILTRHLATHNKPVSFHPRVYLRRCADPALPGQGWVRVRELRSPQCFLVLQIVSEELLLALLRRSAQEYATTHAHITMVELNR